MEGKRRNFKINVLLINMLVICVVISIVIIVSSTYEKQIELIGKSGNKIKNNYTTTEGTSNTWDVSKNGDGSVIATLVEDGILTISGIGEMKDNVNWQDKKNEIKSVIVQEGVTSIGKDAFYRIANLETVKLSNSVISIGDTAFYCCYKLKTVEFSSNLRSIGKNSFCFCYDLENIVFPNNLISIGKGAFANCTELIKVKIPSSVSSIGLLAFSSCEKLTEIKVEENNSYYCDIDGVLLTIDKQQLLCYPAGKSEEKYVVPETVTDLKQSSFSDCYNLLYIDIPGNVKNIEDSVFWGCTYLKEVNFQEGLINIGEDIFAYCENLKNIKIPSTVQSIASRNLLEPCKLESIEVDENNQKYSSQNGVLFNKDKTVLVWYPDCKKDEYYDIPDTVKTIGEDHFLMLKNWLV